MIKAALSWIKLSLGRNSVTMKRDVDMYFEDAAREAGAERAFQ